MRPSVTVEVLSPDSVVITPVSEIDYSTVPAVRDALLDAQMAGVRRVTVDMARVTFVDSAAVSTLVAAARRQRADGGQVVLRDLSSIIKHTFVITDTLHLFDTEPDAPAPGADHDHTPADTGPSRRPQWRQQGTPF
jgi:anti-anti-sigma factor